MSGSRFAHTIAAMMCGLAFAALLFGAPRIATALLAVVALIITASVEALRDHAENQKDRK